MFYDTYDADASRVETTQYGALDGMITLHCSTTAIHRAKRNQIAVGTRQHFSKLQSVKKKKSDKFSFAITYISVSNGKMMLPITRLIHAPSAKIESGH